MTGIDVSIGDDVTMRPGAGSPLGHIDQYELVRELGGGGFGCVYLAKDTVAGIEVAVKGLPPDVRHNKEELGNIRANFALVSRLHHPNIAAALVLHPAKDVAYANREAKEKLRVFERDTLLVMEYAPGVTLSQWRRQFSDLKVPLAEALELTRQIAAALDFAHAQKIIHRDIKPANVMVETKTDGSLVARILDFGLAAEIRSSMGRVSREIRDTSGTRPYMAPEQWRGAKQGPATDQYALAAMFCELVTGEVPFASVFETGDPVVMKNTVLNDTPEFPKELPKTVRAALLKALAKTPEGRFATCGAFVDALAGRKSDDGAPVGKTRMAVVAALLAAVVFGGWWWFGRRVVTSGTVGPTGSPSPTTSASTLQPAQVGVETKSNDAAFVRLAALPTNVVTVAIEEEQPQVVVPGRPQADEDTASQVDTYEHEQELRRQQGREAARLARAGQKAAENGAGTEPDGVGCQQGYAAVEQCVEEKKKREDARILEAKLRNDAIFRTVKKKGER